MHSTQACDSKHACKMVSITALSRANNRNNRDNSSGSLITKKLSELQMSGVICKMLSISPAMLKDKQTRNGMAFM